MKTLLYQISELKTFRDNFTKELGDTFKGKKTSLSFLKNILSHGENNNVEDFQVISFGGSNFEETLFKKDLGSFDSNFYSRGSIPIVENREIFLEFISNHLFPNVGILALNFAHSLTPIFRNNAPDGVLNDGSKEHAFEGLINCAIGEEIEKYILKVKGRKIQVVVANDIVCLVLAGLSSNSDPLSIVGGVLGTGVNFGLFYDKNTIINLESANFNGFNQTETGKIIDSNSLCPTQDIFEKEVSGAYLYQHFNLINKIYNKNWSNLTSSDKLNDLIESDGEESLVAQEIIERSASLVAVQIAGIYGFKKKLLKGNFVDEKFKITFIMEGGLFWKGRNYKTFVEKYINILDIPKDGIEFVNVENSSLVGAAALVK